MKKLSFLVFSATASSTLHAHEADPGSGGLAALLYHWAGHPEVLLTAVSLAGLAVLIRRHSSNKR